MTRSLWNPRKEHKADGNHKDKPVYENKIQYGDKSIEEDSSWNEDEIENPTTQLETPKKDLQIEWIRQKIDLKVKYEI